MARRQAVQVDNKFINGLVTDTTALNFPENACTDTLNCVFNHTGRITRRLGIDRESASGGTFSSLVDSNSAFTEYLWFTSEGIEKKSFAVYQIGSYILFSDVSDSTLVADNFESFTVDLRAYPLPVTYFDPNDWPCQYTTVNNKLLIVNKATNPLLVTYDEVLDTISVSEITLQFRDFEGLEDGLDLYERVTSSYAALQTSNPAHAYNILNQGWHTGDALTQWDAARTDMPSNSDQVNFFRASETDSFDNARVTAYSSVLNTPAPRGHFILEVGNESRTQALQNEGFSGIVIPTEAVLIAAGTGSVIHNATSLSANAFDSNLSQAAAASATWNTVPGIATGIPSGVSPRIGKDYSATPQRIGYATVVASNDQGFATGSSSITIRFQLWGKNGSAPTTSIDGTFLGTSVITLDSSSLNVSIGSNDNVTEWDYVWVTFQWLGSAASSLNMYIAECQFYTSNNTISFHRPQTVASFAGRAWYAGLEDGSLNNNIYFSRIILKDSDFGKCYQANDPTSEFLSEILPDDGGVIRLIEAANILKIFPYQNSILVFATNGIWRINFSSATDYSVRKISSVNLESTLSLVDIKGIPTWWSDDGIYTVQYEANFDAFSVVSLTDDKIKEFYVDIPRFNRRYSKGAYDKNNDYVYWLYNDDGTSTYSYLKVLVMSTRTGAFFPWEFKAGPTIRSINYIEDATGNNDPIIKYLVQIGSNFVGADIRDTTYEDWTYTGGTSFDSYFTTGYKIHGETQRHVQANHIFVFLDTVEDSSCFIQGIFDYSNSSTSGKWSTTQQIYNPNRTFRDINYRRLKIRGRGRAIQLKFTSDEGKPFSIIGWSLGESQDANL